MRASTERRLRQAAPLDEADARRSYPLPRFIAEEVISREPLARVPYDQAEPETEPETEAEPEPRATAGEVWMHVVYALAIIGVLLLGLLIEGRVL